MAKYIKEFMESEYTDYAVYRVLQRLPNLIDSVAQTQRKILHVLSRLPENKKSKTAGVYNLVYSQTNYLHGDKSVYTVVENLARESSNNINILTQEGSFGYRTNRAAAAPRYTSTRFSQAARLIFRKEDIPILPEQEFEGNPMEPVYLSPIIPITLINGFTAVSVGYASKFLPRNPKELIDEMIRILKSQEAGKTPRVKKLTPAFPFYDGNIIQNTEHNDSAAWFLTGKLTKSKRKGWVEITEVPPEYTRESYVKKLKGYLNKDLIKDFSESCSKNTFNFRVKVSPELWVLTEDQLLEKLGLIDKFVENFTFLDSASINDDTSSTGILKYNTAEEYLMAFIKERQKLYIARKEYHLRRLIEEIKILEEKIRFINMVNDGDIIITKRKKVDLEKDLQSMGYTKLDENFDYLLGMKMHALTTENVKKFQHYIDERKKEVKRLEEITPEQMHIQELRELLMALKPELQKKGLV